MGIRNKILFITLILVIGPLLFVGFFSYNKSASILEESFVANIHEMNASITDGLEKELEGYLYGVEAIAENVDSKEILIHPEYEPFLRALFTNYVDNYPRAYQIYMGTYDGGIRIEPDVELAEDYDPTSRAWYISAEEKGVSGWTDLYIDVVSGNYSIAGYSPVVNDGEYIGAVATSLDLSEMSNEIGEIVVGEKGYVFVLDSEGKVVFHPNTDLIGDYFEVEDIQDAIIDNPSDGIIYYEYEGEDKFAVFEYMEDTRWYIMTSMYTDEIGASSRAILYNIIAIGGVALIITVLISVVFANSITKPISALVSSMKKVEDGDMTVKTQVKSKDEIGILSKSFNTMIDNVSSLLKDAKSVSEQVTTASETLAANAEETSASTEEVARTVEEIAHGASEQAKDSEDAVNMTSTFDRKLNNLAINSGKIHDNATHVISINQKGGDILLALKEATNVNITSTGEVTEAVHRLEENSADIENIVETISSIADQTNLLALNASIEAARAGEHGRGFAVVADEIRKLAEESAKSASQIFDIVKVIQNQTKETVEVVDKVKENADLQSVSVSNMDQSFSDISVAINEITSKINDINVFINELQEDKDEIVTAITNISSVSEETAAASEEVSVSVEQQNSAVDSVAMASEQLHQLAEDLGNQINRFKV